MSTYYTHIVNGIYYTIGKSRAKRYVQKALSFALEMGYLVPADREGKLLCVSQSLVKPVSGTAKSARSAMKQRKSSGKVQKQQPPQHRSRNRNRKSSSAAVRRKSIVTQGDESIRQKRQARKKVTSEGSSAGTTVEDVHQSGKTLVCDKLFLRERERGKVYTKRLFISYSDAKKKQARRKARCAVVGLKNRRA